MSDDMRELQEGGNYRNRIDIFLDDEREPLVSYRPPLRFELDTSQIEDGRHVLRIEAYDSIGTKGVRKIPFTVRNGPGIAVSGLGDNDVLEGSIPILVNSYGGAVEQHWEPSRAETPAPVPTWAWVMLIVFVAFSGFYGVRQLRPPTSFASTPTYGTVAASSVPAEGISEVGQQAGTTAQASSTDTEEAPATGTAPQPEDPRVAGEATEAATGVATGAGTEAASRSAAGPGPETVPTAETVAFDAELGAGVYGSYCSACHQANGQGLPGVFPPMAGDPVVTATDPAEHIEIVLHGLQGKSIGGVAYASPMPAFGGQLTDEQIAAVVNHERTSWGNDAPLVSPAEVATQR